MHLIYLFIDSKKAIYLFPVQSCDKIRENKTFLLTISMQRSVFSNINNTSKKDQEN